MKLLLILGSLTLFSSPSFAQKASTSECSITFKTETGDIDFQSIEKKTALKADRKLSRNQINRCNAAIRRISGISAEECKVTCNPNK